MKPPIKSGRVKQELPAIAAVFKKPKSKYAPESLDKLEENIRAYCPDFDFPELRKLLEKSKPAIKPGKIKSIDDYYSDSLAMVEELVKLAKADRDTLLTVLIYPYVHRIAGVGPDKEELQNIENNYGSSTRLLVERTMRFRSLNLPTFISKEDVPKYIELSLWAARDPRAILSPGTQVMDNLQQLADNKEVFSPEAAERLLVSAEAVYVPLMHIAGYDTIGKKMSNLCFKIRNPNLHQKARKTISSPLTPKDQEDIKEKLAQNLEKELGWSRNIHFTVEFREKDAASAQRKAVRKGQDISDLGDLYGARIILKRAVLDKLTKHNEIDDFLKLGAQCMRAYGKLSREFGRANVRKINRRIKPGSSQTESFSFIQERLKELAEHEPRDKDKGRLDDPKRAALERELYPDILDARFDNYIGKEIKVDKKEIDKKEIKVDKKTVFIDLQKASGYSSVQDVFWITLDGHDKPIEIECQVVDEMRHDINTYGPRAGHIYYKTGLHHKAESVIDWLDIVGSELTVRKKPSVKPVDRKPAREHVLVFDAEDKIVDVSDDPTVAGFIQKTGLENCQEAIIFNDYDRFASDVTYGGRTPLRPGDHVKGIISARKLDT